MALTSTKPLQSDPVQCLENLRPSSVKAGLPSDQIGLDPGEVTLGAVVSFYGSIKDAAFALGRVDPSLMCREIRILDLRRVKKHGTPELFDAISDAQKIAFGPMDTPKLAAMRLFYDIRRRLDQLEQILEGVA